MKKKHSKSVSGTAKRPAAQTVPDMGKRRSMKLLRNGALATVVLGVVGVSVNAVQATMAEHNLDRIGQGTPVVVQIHDPQCPLCIALQKQARKAMRSFDDQELTYLVANINTEEGAALAVRHGVPHVTLVLLDGQGNMREIIRGPSTREALETAFAAHLAGLN